MRRERPTTRTKPLRLLVILGIVVLSVLTVSGLEMVFTGRDDSAVSDLTTVAGVRPDSSTVADSTVTTSVDNSAASDPTTSISVEPPGPKLSFVQRNGRDLTVDGKRWQFGGYNLPCANPFVLDQPSLDFYLDTVQQTSGANAIRAWFFQTNGGPGNWAPFDRVVAAVKARGMRVVATLTDEWNGGCDGGAGTRKTIDWYQGGYKAPDEGHTLSYRDYAVAVATHFAAEPAIALWQLVNEAESPRADLSCDNAAGAAALRAFADDVTGAIKVVDRNHLVSLGTIGGSQCGLAGSAAYQQVHDGLVDMCEYHDYGTSAAAWPDGTDRLAQRVHDCDTLPSGAKPLFVGEAGIQSNVQSDGGPPECRPWPGCNTVEVTAETLSQRATFFEAKIKAALEHGVAGYMIWVKSPYYDPTDDIYAIGDNDPTDGAVRAALLPGAPTIASVRPCDGGVVVDWTAPTYVGIGSIAGYTVTASDGTTTATGPAATTAVIAGLQNQTEYTLSIATSGPEGDGAPSEPSAPVTPSKEAGACPPS